MERWAIWRLLTFGYQLSAAFPLNVHSCESSTDVILLILAATAADTIFLRSPFLACKAWKWKIPDCICCNFLSFSFLLLFLFFSWRGRQYIRRLLCLPTVSYFRYELSQFCADFDPMVTSVTIRIIITLWSRSQGAEMEKVGQRSVVLCDTSTADSAVVRSQSLIYCSRTELRSCVRVEMDVLGSTSLIVRMVTVDIKQHWTRTSRASPFIYFSPSLFLPFSSLLHLHRRSLLHLCILPPVDPPATNCLCPSIQPQDQRVWPFWSVVRFPLMYFCLDRVCSADLGIFFFGYVYDKNWNSNSETVILRDSSVRSIWTYLAASPWDLLDVYCPVNGVCSSACDAVWLTGR